MIEGCSPNNNQYGIQQEIIDGTRENQELTLFNDTMDNILIQSNTIIGREEEVQEDYDIESVYKVMTGENLTETNQSRNVKRSEMTLDELDLSKLDIGDLSPRQKKKLINIIQKYHFIFSRNEYDIGRYNGKRRYTVHLTTDEFQRKRHIPTPTNHKDLIDKHIEKLLKSGIIEEIPPTDEITTNLVLVKKKDGTWRVANDSRSVNNITKRKSNFPIPRITDMLQLYVILA